MGADPCSGGLTAYRQCRVRCSGRAEELFDVFESLVAQPDIVAVQGGLGQACAQHVDAVEGGLGGDRLVVARKVNVSSVMVMWKCLAIL